MTDSDPVITLAATTRITAPPSAVIAFIADPANAPRWMKALEVADLITPSPIRPGSRFREVMSAGGKRVEATSLARGYQDPHFVEPKPSFVLKLSKANLLIVAGLDLEIGYLPPLLDQSRNAKIRPGNPGYLDASIGCEILERPRTVVTRAMGDVHPFGNPHYWLSPGNGRVIARAIASGS